jgi:hypothetical protein
LALRVGHVTSNKNAPFRKRSSYRAINPCMPVNAGIRTCGFGGTVATITTSVGSRVCTGISGGGNGHSPISMSFEQMITSPSSANAGNVIKSTISKVRNVFMWTVYADNTLHGNKGYPKTFCKALTLSDSRNSAICSSVASA